VNFAFFSFLINGKLDHALFRVLALDFAYNSEKLWVQTNCLFVCLDSSHAGTGEIIYVQVMVGVSFAHDIVEGKCLRFFTVDFVNLIILFVVFGSNNTADSNECVELISTPDAF
jgi:hypothetical protein